MREIIYFREMRYNNSQNGDFFFNDFILKLLKRIKYVSRHIFSLFLPYT